MSVFERLGQLEREAMQLGFCWEAPSQIIAQVKSECEEVLAHFDAPAPSRSALQEEIGDLLHAALSLTLFCQFSPEETLEKALDKFEARLQAVRSVAHQKGLDTLKGQSFEELMAIWEAAKRVG